jgi:hypothetical protein
MLYHFSLSEQNEPLCPNILSSKELSEFLMHAESAAVVALW